MIKKPPSNRLAARLRSAALAFILLVAGMGAAPAQTVPPPPDPDRYHNWRHSEQALPVPARNGNVQPQGSLTPQTCYYRDIPNISYWTALVYTGAGSDFNGEIYITQGICSNSAPATRLTFDYGWDTSPRLNRDASQVVFMSDRTGNNDIYIVNSTGGVQTNLTNAPYYEGQPSFSGTDSRIVFVSDRYGSSDIFIMNPDGSGLYQVTSGPNDDLEPDWSPDGKLITFSRRIPNSNSAQIYVVNWDGTNLHAITPPLAYASRPVWSPTGTRIAFGYDYNNDDWFDLAIMNADGSGLTALPVDKSSDPFTDFFMGGWVPDESGLVISGVIYFYDAAHRKFISTNYKTYEVMFSNFTVAQDLWLAPYAFTPHTRSLDDVPPVSRLTALLPFRPARFGLYWTVTDSVSGPGRIDIEYHTDSDPTWRLFYTENYYSTYPLVNGAASFEGVPGDKVFFRAQAVDHANNTEAKKSAAEVSTTLYKWVLTAGVTDTRERRLSRAAVDLTPAALEPLTTGANGSNGGTAVTTDTTFQAVVSKPGYATLPAQTWPVTSDITYLTTLPGAREQIVNGQFEDTSNPDPNNPFPGWTVSGGPVTAQAGRLGGNEVSIAVPQSASPTQVSLSQQVTIPADMPEPTLSFYYSSQISQPSWQSELKVQFTPQGEAAMRLFDSKAWPQHWTHVWVDLTPYQGKTGTLAIVMEKAANDSTYTAVLDQFSLASAQGLTIDQVSPVRVAAPFESDLTVDVRGTNFQAGDTLTFGGNSIPFTLLDSTHLTFTIPAGTDAGPYPVRLQPSGGVEVTYPQPVFIGTFLHLPFTFQR